MKGLTARQRQILDFVDEHTSHHRFSPSYREIMTYFKFRSLASVHKHIQALKRKGHLLAEKGAARSLSIEQERKKNNQIEILLPFLGHLGSKTLLEKTSSQTIAIPASLVTRPDKSYLLRVSGENFQEEQIQDGDLLIVEARSSALAGEMILAIINRQDTLIKRYFPEGPYIRLESGNPHYRPLLLRQDNLQIQGIIVGLLRTYI